MENVGLASMHQFAYAGVLNKTRQHDVISAKLDQLSVRPRGVRRIVRQLSGGNQQKVVLSKWLLVDNVGIFIFDEPTRGVDIATKVEIYPMLSELADAGRAISSSHPKCRKCWA